MTIEETFDALENTDWCLLLLTDAYKSSKAKVSNKEVVAHLNTLSLVADGTISVDKFCRLLGINRETHKWEKQK